MTAETSSPTTECERAIALGVEALHGAEPHLAAEPNEFALVAVRIEGTLARWHLTFKARNLIPSAGDGVVGAGGEIFVAVDLLAGTGRIVGLGE